MAFLAFLMTFAQMAALLGSYWMQEKAMFMMVAVYASPVYLLMNMFGGDGFILDGNFLLISFFVWHLLKYAFFIRARMVSGAGGLFWTGILLEGAYLSISGYYLN